MLHISTQYLILMYEGHLSWHWWRFINITTTQYQACFAQLGDGRFGVDLAATRVRGLGGRVHGDWARERWVFIDTVIQFPSKLWLGFHRYWDRVFINTLVVFLLIMRIGQATGGRHQYCHENYAIFECAHRHCLAYSNWPITAGRWSIPSKIGILNCQNHHLSTITTNASHDILSISIMTSAWTAHRQASWSQRLVRLVQRWLLLTLHVYCQPPKQPSRMPAPGT